WLGLGLALAASMALNLGYLLQHRGAGTAPPVTPRHPVTTLAGLLSSGAWLAGLACGLGGWALHVAALSRAPLSLVQAFVAGGLGAVARSPWLAGAVLATAGAFFCFQRGLQTGRALPVIALMTAATNLVSIAGGLVVLSEPLGRTPVVVATHAGAFVLVGVAA